jgi:hypothetical protein
MKKLNFTVIILIIISITACKNSNEKIEIYLLKERKLSIDGTPFVKLKMADTLSKEILESYKYSSYNEIDSTITFSGKFIAEKKDLNEKPLISDDDILSLDLKTNEIRFSETGIFKIRNIKPNFKYSTQFVICVNKEPQLTGYFMNVFSSFPPTWNYIVYSNQKQINDKKIEERYLIEQNDKFEKFKPYLTNLKLYPKLINSFENSNRLIK